MAVLKIGVALIIALFYNIFVHYLISTIYKNDSYNEKMSNGTLVIIIAGIGAIALAFFISSSIKVYQNVVSLAMLLGGSALLMTAVISQWESIEDIYKLLISGGGLGLLLWISCKHF